MKKVLILLLIIPSVIYSVTTRSMAKRLNEEAQNSRRSQVYARPGIHNYRDDRKFSRELTDLEERDEAMQMAFLKVLDKAEYSMGTAFVGLFKMVYRLFDR